MRTPPPHRPHFVKRRGFTLLEMVAVVAIMGMMMYLVAPSIGVTQTAQLRSGAREMGAHLEFARQRAIMTGKPHRVLIEIDEGWYQLEWFVSDRDEDPRQAAAATDLRGPVQMSPRHDQVPSYRIIPGSEGRLTWIDETLDFAGVEVDDGWYDSGEFQVVFQGDGSSDAARIVLRADPEEAGLILEVSPLLDAVRIYDEEV